MRPGESYRLKVGDHVTLSQGLYAGLQGRVVEVQEVSTLVGRARLRVAQGEDYWHPFWNEPMDEAEWLTRRATAPTSEAGDLRGLLLSAGLPVSEDDPQRALLRDLFGNPFRRPVIDPAWLSRHEGAVSRLAREIYDERRFDEMPVLGDALED